MPKKKSAYAATGVDIDRMDDALKRAKRSIRSTQTSGVLSEVGSFGGLFKAPGKDGVLVSSIDGVGTKLEVARLAGRHDTVGQCLVNHCTNDILVQGASPLFFMDYLGTGALEPAAFADVVSGIARACRKNQCALIGGETAEMPGLYQGHDYDLVGAIVGEVKKSDLVTGESIRAGDVLIGLRSSGLHTNGYSLARHIIFKQKRLKVDDLLPGTRRRVGPVLLAVHKSYLESVQRLMKSVKVRGMAHITGGGLLDNIPRILPEGLGAEIDTGTWRVPAVFRFLQEAGRVERDEMFRVFNMGIGYVIIVRPADEKKTIATLRRTGEKPVTLGRVTQGPGRVELL